MCAQRMATAATAVAAGTERLLVGRVGQLLGVLEETDPLTRGPLHAVEEEDS
jgi:hypothetical protein